MGILVRTDDGFLRRMESSSSNSFHGRRGKGRNVIQFVRWERGANSGLVLVHVVVVWIRERKIIVTKARLVPS